MNSDIRLQSTFFQHPKIVKLGKRGGPQAQVNLIRLWIWIAQNKPDGDLEGMTDEDIEIAAGADSGINFVGILVEFKLLDGDEGNRKVHNWEKHQPWVFGSGDRSEHARKAAIARWRNAPSINEHTERMPAASDENATSMRGAQSSNAPLLSSPILSQPKPEETDMSGNSAGRLKKPPVVKKEKSYLDWLASDKPHVRMVGYYVAAYLQAFNVKPSLDMAATPANAKSLIKRGITEEQFKATVDRWMSMEPKDEFDAKWIPGHTWPMFIKHFDKLLDTCKHTLKAKRKLEVEVTRLEEAVKSDPSDRNIQVDFENKKRELSKLYGNPDVLGPKKDVNDVQNTPM